MNRDREQQWADVALAPSPYRPRLELIAGFVPPSSVVLDVGAGSMELRGLLPAGCTYLPLDCVASSPETIVIDLETADAIDRIADVVVLSGVLEHLELPRRALGLLRNVAPRLLLSYDLRLEGEDPAMERGGWRNHMTEYQLISLLSGAGWAASRVAQWKEQGIFAAVLV